MKKLVPLVCALLAVLLLTSVTAFAAGPQFFFELKADGEQTLTANPGEVITISLEIERTDSDAPYTMYAMQDEIRYDSSFFELVDGGVLLGSGISSTDISVRGGFREFYMNFLSMTGGTSWNKRTLIGSFQLRVLADSGASKITNEDFLVSLPDGRGSYACTANTVTVIVTTDCSIRFELGDGSSLPDVVVTYGEKLVRPEDPVREGKIFAGWYKDIDLTEPWDFDNDVVSGNVTLYAKWDDAPVVPAADTAGDGSDETGGTRSPDGGAENGADVPWYVYAGGLAGLAVLAFAVKKLIDLFSAAGAAVNTGVTAANAAAAAAGLSAAAAAAAAGGFNVPELQSRTIIACLPDTPANVELIRLLSKKNKVDLKVIPYAEKSTIAERAEEDDADMVIISADGPDPETAALVAKLKENDKGTLLGIVTKPAIDKAVFDSLAIKPAVANDGETASRMMAKLLTPLFKADLSIENGAKTVGELADALGIPLVSTIVGVFLAGKDIAEVVADKDADGIDAAYIAGDIAEILGFGKLANVAHGITSASVVSERSKDKKNTKEILKNAEKNDKTKEGT